MSLSDHVQLSIVATKIGIARAGFGIPMILSANASFTERIRFYSNLAAVVADFASDSPEALAATAFFSQQPSPAKIAIGRSALPPTQVYEFTPIAINDHVYNITVVNEGGTTETVSFTADATATIAEITLGLLALLNAVVGKNFTAVDNTTSLTITGDAPGNWFSLELGNPGADGKIEQTHVDPGVATDLAAIRVEDDSWYALHTLYNSSLYVTAAATWIETQKKIYVASVSETDAIKVAVGGASDTLDDLATLNFGRTAGVYHPSPAAFNDASWMGKCLPTEPGTITWKFKTLKALAAVNLTDTHRTNLVNKKGNFNENVAGQNIMSEGTTADGDFIDVQRGIDWLDDDMSKAVLIAFVAAAKISYTDGGVGVLESEVRASLQRAVARTILTSDPAPIVTVPEVASVAVIDRAARALPDIKFTGILAGAIHKVVIDGVVSV